MHRIGKWSKHIELGTCIGTRLGLYSLSFGLCLTKKMLLFSILHLALNDHSGHNASAKRFVITKDTHAGNNSKGEVPEMYLSKGNFRGKKIAA